MWNDNQPFIFFEPFSHSRLTCRIPRTCAKCTFAHTLPASVHVFSPSSQPSPASMKVNRWKVILMGAALTSGQCLCVSEAASASYTHRPEWAPSMPGEPWWATTKASSVDRVGLQWGAGPPRSPGRGSGVFTESWARGGGPSVGYKFSRYPIRNIPRPQVALITCPVS